MDPMEFVRNGVRAQEAVDAVLGKPDLMEKCLADVVTQFKSLLAASEDLRKKTDTLIAINGYQNEMVEVMLDELMALAQTEAIPLFFKKQILGTILKVKEIGKQLAAV